MDSDSQELPAKLSQWFESVLNLTENSLFSIAPEGPHCDAVVLDALLRNARIIHRAELDHDGKLYSPLCFFLAAACRRLKTRAGRKVLAVGAGQRVPPSETTGEIPPGFRRCRPRDGYPGDTP